MPEDMSKDPRHSPIRALAHVFLYCLGGALVFYSITVYCESLTRYITETTAFHLGILSTGATLVPLARFMTKWKRKNIQDSPQFANEFR
ncbi:hypothetical protein FRC00_011547, partial [Tulasnella sp. 408]